MAKHITLTLNGQQQVIVLDAGNTSDTVDTCQVNDTSLCLGSGFTYPLSYIANVDGWTVDGTLYPFGNVNGSFIDADALAAWATTNDPNGYTWTDTGGEVCGFIPNVDRAEYTEFFVSESSASITLTSSFTAPLALNDPITYTYTVLNTGDIDITGITVTDSLGNTITGGSTTLTPGQSTDFTSTYNITQPDIDAGQVVNTTDMDGNSEAGAVDAQDSITDNVSVNPALTLVKTGDGSGLSDPPVVGQIISYTFTVTNTGDVTLNNVNVTDDKVTPSGGSTTLAPTDVTNFTGDYAVTQSDIDAGQVVNLATAYGDYDAVTYDSGQQSDTVTISNTPASGYFRVETADIDIGGVTESTSQIITPCDTIYYGAGINSAVNTTTYPFTYSGGYNDEFDVWDGDVNAGEYPGGGINSKTVWSPSSNANVTIPNRYYAINNTSLAPAGITQPGTHWHQNHVRFNLTANGSGNTPTAATQIPHVQAALTEGADLGTVMIASIMEFTGADPAAITQNYDDPITSFTTSTDLGAAVEMCDGVVTHTKTDYSSLTTNTEKGYVWYEFTNEPFTADGNNNQPYFDWMTWWIKRIRLHHGAENIIVVNLAGWGQDLAGLAAGYYDTWWNDLAIDPSGDLTRNIVFDWHAYGADTVRPGSYTYANMDTDLNTVIVTKQYPLIVGEYGQTAAVGSPYAAGVDADNRNAVNYLMTDTSGSGGGVELALKYNIHPTVWSATGDTTENHWFKLTQGADLANPTGPLVPGVDGLSIPFWDILLPTVDQSKLEPLGQFHVNVSEQLHDKNSMCFNPDTTGVLPDGTATMIMTSTNTSSATTFLEPGDTNTIDAPACGGTVTWEMYVEPQTQLGWVDDPNLDVWLPIPAEDGQTSISVTETVTDIDQDPDLQDNVTVWFRARCDGDIVGIVEMPINYDGTL